MCVPGRPLHRTHDRGVAGAPADLAGDGLADLVLGRVGIAVEQRASGDHHAGRAEPALQSVTLHEPLLDGVEPAVNFETLDCADAVTGRHSSEHRAGMHGFAVELDDTRATVA